MATNGDYRVLILTSDSNTISEVTEIGEKNFEHVNVVFWEMGNMSTKPEVLHQIDAVDYNLIVSYINGIILKEHHLATAEYGAINIHPAPPEHGGAFGIWCQPVIDRGLPKPSRRRCPRDRPGDRSRPIYRVRRWDVADDEAIQSVAERSFGECLQIFDEVAEELGQSPNGTRCFDRLDESWHPTNRNHTVEDVRRWFEALDPAHPAHEERVLFNHPRAILGPPYFDDL